MKVVPPGGVNISRCITASTSRATLTRNSSQTRRGRDCSPTSASGSSETSPSIQRRIDSIIPTAFHSPFQEYASRATSLLRTEERGVDPALVVRVRVGLRARVLDDLHLPPLAVG